MQANLLKYNSEKIKPQYAIGIRLSTAEMQSLTPNTELEESSARPNISLEGKLTFTNGEIPFVLKIDAARPNTTIDPPNGSLQSEKTITLGRKAYDLIKKGHIFTDDIGEDYSLAIQI